MKKSLIMMLTLLCMAIGITGCGNSAGPEVYTGQKVYIEEAYKGDVWNGVSESLTLNADGTYIRTENTSIIHSSGAIVTYWTYTMKGTYEVKSEDEDVKSVTLSKPTQVSYVMNDSLMTEADDSTLLDYADEVTFELNKSTLKYTLN